MRHNLSYHIFGFRIAAHIFTFSDFKRAFHGVSKDVAGWKESRFRKVV